MTLSGSARLVAAFGAVVALTITAPVAADAGQAGTGHASRTDSAKASTGKPSVGQCRNLSAAQAAAPSDSSNPTGCKAAHTSRVIAVPTLPKGVSYADLNAAKIGTLAVKLCYPPYRGALGQSDQVRDTTAYSYLYFIPTAKQRSTGARWLRCDLTLRHGTGLAKLPTDKKPALTKHPKANVKRCLTGKKLITTTCSMPHSYVAAGAVKIKLKKYPSRKAMVKIGRSRCPAITVTDADFRFTWMGKTVWNVARDHTLVCYNRHS